MIGKTVIRLSHESVKEALDEYLNNHFNTSCTVRVDKWSPDYTDAVKLDGGQLANVQVECTPVGKFSAFEVSTVQPGLPSGEG